jgi:glucose-1-phosphate thymidylyltransferase
MTMQNLKGLVLSGGRGTRLRPITHTSAKQLVPVANKPVLYYGLEAMARAGIEEVGIIIAPETGDTIREATGDGGRFGLRITYIEQDEPKGLAHAVLTAERYLGSSPFVMYLGDNLLKDGITELVESFKRSKPDALILLAHVLEPSLYGVAVLEGDRVIRLIEKPEDPPSDLALVGVYMFTSAIFDAARAIQPSWRDELEITDAIQVLIDRGLRVEPHVVRGWWKDTGRLEDILEANRLILEDLETRIDGELIDSQVEGRVVVEAGARLERTVVRGPAIIGAGSRITDAYIGPYSAIDANVTIERAEVEHSIVMADSSISDLAGRMEASLIGRNVLLRRNHALPKAYRFMVGDNSEIQIL